MNSYRAKVGLGTALFGMPYGSHSNDPLIPQGEVEEILSFAVRSGIRFYDTASNYGVSEDRLGGFHLKKKAKDAVIASKIPSVDKEIHSNPTKYCEFVSEKVRQSLKRLELSKFPLIQFHQSALPFLEGQAVREATKYLLNEGLCDAIGFSVYDPEEAVAAVQIPGVEAIQFPLNLLDQRFADKAFHRTLGRVRLIARSVFLQGILVPEAAVPRVARAEDLARYKRKAEAIAKDLGFRLERLALQYVFSEVEDISIGIIGVDSKRALRDNLETIQLLQASTFPEVGKYFSDLGCEMQSEGLHDPRNWTSRGN